MAFHPAALGLPKTGRYEPASLVSFRQFSSVQQTAQVVFDGCAAVEATLDAGLVPVLHGDAVFDQSLGCTILR